MENIHTQTDRQAQLDTQKLSLASSLEESVQLSLPVCLCVCFPLHDPATLHAAQVRTLPLSLSSSTASTLLPPPRRRADERNMAAGIVRRGGSENREKGKLRLGYNFDSFVRRLPPCLSLPPSHRYSRWWLIRTTQSHTHKAGKTAAVPAGWVLVVDNDTMYVELPPSAIVAETENMVSDPIDRTDHPVSLAGRGGNERIERRGSPCYLK